MAKGWQKVGEELKQGWRRVGGFPCTLQFQNSRGARLETRVCDSMDNFSLFLVLVTFSDAFATPSITSLLLCRRTPFTDPFCGSVNFHFWKLPPDFSESKGQRSQNTFTDLPVPSRPEFLQKKIPETIVFAIFCDLFLAR